MSAELIDAYTAYVSRESDSAGTIRARRYYVERLSQTADPLTVTETDVEDWLRSHDWAPASYNAALASLRHFFKWATRYGHRPDNPATYLKRARQPRKMGRIAGDEEIALAAMRAPLSTRIMLHLGAECGLRRSEIAKVHRDDITADGWLHVVGKGGHERTVFLSDNLRELLAVHKEEGWLFPSPNGGHLCPQAVYQRVRRVSGYNTHALRHRAGTTVYERTGGNLRVAQEFLGHATPTMTAKYVHITRGDLQRAAEAATLDRSTAARAASNIPSLDDRRAAKRALGGGA